MEGLGSTARMIFLPVPCQLRASFPRDTHDCANCEFPWIHNAPRFGGTPRFDTFFAIVCYSELPRRVRDSLTLKLIEAYSRATILWVEPLS
jgi:hypothetical protein